MPGAVVRPVSRAPLTPCRFLCSDDSSRLCRRERDTATIDEPLRFLPQVCAHLLLPLHRGQPATVMVPTTGAADESAAGTGVIGRHSLLPPPLLSELMIAAASLSSIKASSEAEIASAAGLTPSGIAAGATPARPDWRGEASNKSPRGAYCLGAKGPGGFQLPYTPEASRPRLPAYFEPPVRLAPKNAPLTRHSSTPSPLAFDPHSQSCTCTRKHLDVRHFV